jgi:hypothetical protein
MSSDTVAILYASQTYFNHHRRWFGWFDKLVSVSAETNEKLVLETNEQFSEPV